jgi:hypothetical protein
MRHLTERVELGQAGIGGLLVCQRKGSGGGEYVEGLDRAGSACD